MTSTEVEVPKSPEEDGGPSLDQPQKGAGAWADPLYQPNPADRGYRIISDRPFGTDI